MHLVKYRLRQKIQIKYDFNKLFVIYFIITICEVKRITDTPEKEPYISNVVGKASRRYTTIMMTSTMNLIGLGVYKKMF